MTFVPRFMKEKRSYKYKLCKCPIQVLMKSDALNCQNSMLELLANSFAQKGALWLLYGKMEMSSLASQLLLRLHTLDTMPHSGYSGESTCLALCCVGNAFIQEVSFM